MSFRCTDLCLVHCSVILDSTMISLGRFILLVDVFIQAGNANSSNFIIPLSTKKIWSNFKISLSTKKFWSNFIIPNLRIRLKQIDSVSVFILGSSWPSDFHDVNTVISLDPMIRRFDSFRIS